MKSDKLEELNKSEKILIAIGELSKENQKKITVEDVAVKIWKLWPSEFCMRGYPEYPNVDIQKHITKLLDNNLVSGGVFNYIITSKGKEYFKKITDLKKIKKSEPGKVNADQPRYIKSEVERIINTKVFKYFNEDEKLDLLEYDFFEFIGSSSRSLNTKDRNIFLNRLNTLVKDVVPYCEEKSKEDIYCNKIIRLWKLLYEKFKYLLDKNEK